MKELLLIFLISFSGICLRAQTNLDSLYSVWQDQNQSDSVRTISYKDYIAKGFLFSQPDTAFVFANELIAFGKSKDYPKAEALGLRLLGVSYTLKGDYAKALYFQSSSLKIMEDLGDQKEISSSLNNIALIYYTLSDHSKALAYFQRAVKIGENLNDPTILSGPVSNIGLIYQDEKNFPKALEYFQKGIEYANESENKRNLSLCFSNISTIYLEQGNYIKAQEYNQRALIINEELDDKYGIALQTSYMGKIYQLKGNYPKALDYYGRSLNIYEELGYQMYVAYILSDIGATNIKQGNYLKALKNCQEGLSLSINAGNLEGQKGAYQCLFDTYKAMGDGNKALVYMEKLRVVEDSLNSEEMGKKLQHMEFQKQILADSLANAEEARLIEEAHKEEVRKKNKTRNTLIGGGLFLFLIAGGIYSRLRYTRKAKEIIEKEKDRSENLLLNILPEAISEELKEKGRADAQDFDMVSILFTDFKGFTAASAKLSASELVTEINACFEAFDGITEKYGVEKIKTIGDAYMAAGGLPVPSDDAVKNTVLAALDMQDFIVKRKEEMDAKNLPAFEMRAGIHTGPVVAGIVGVKKFQYDIWGDTVNTAARMESSGEVQKINVSQATYELLKDDPAFTFESRGKIAAKGMGEIEMYFVRLNTEKE